MGRVYPPHYIMIITSLAKYNPIPSAERIRTEFRLPWLELDIEVPHKEILNEYLNVESDAILHRSDDKVLGAEHKGWRSLTIHGKDKHNTEDSDGILDWTDIADKCPKTVQWIKDNFIINSDVTGRIRFMHLDPGGYILPHHDREEKRLNEINVAIRHPEGCIFKFPERGIIPFVDGKAFMIDISNTHTVYNDSNEMRLHIILHTEVPNNIVERSYEKSYYST